MQIYVIRHCEATGQSEEAPLSDRGVQQAALLANFLKTLELIELSAVLICVLNCFAIQVVAECVQSLVEPLCRSCIAESIQSELYADGRVPAHS